MTFGLLFLEHFRLKLREHFRYLAEQVVAVGAADGGQVGAVPSPAVAPPLAGGGIGRKNFDRLEHRVRRSMTEKLLGVPVPRKVHIK